MSDSVDDEDEDEDEEEEEEEEASGSQRPPRLNDLYEDDNPERDAGPASVASLLQALGACEQEPHGTTCELIDRTIEEYSAVWESAIRGIPLSARDRQRAGVAFDGNNVTAGAEPASLPGSPHSQRSDHSQLSQHPASAERPSQQSQQSQHSQASELIDSGDAPAAHSAGAQPAAGEGVIERLSRLVGCEVDPDSPVPPLSVNDAVLKHVIIMAQLAKLCSRVEDVEDDQPINESMLSSNTESGVRRREKLKHISMAIAAAKNMLTSNALLLSCFNPDAFASLTWEEVLLVHIGDDTAKPHQVLLFHLLDLFSSPANGGPFRRMDDLVFREVITPEGHRTHAWKEHSEILEFIHEHITPTTSYQLWSVLTASDFHMPTRLRDHLVEANHGSFPLLKWNRFLYSFRNGIFNSMQLGFYPYTKRDVWPQMASDYEDRIRTAYPFMTARMRSAYDRASPFAPPGREDASMRFFDYEFDDRWIFPTVPLMEIDWRQIPAPDLLSIFETQGWDEDTIRDKLWSMGKLMFPIGYLENTEIFSFDYGKGGTGKSTSLNIVRSFFHPRRVCVLQSDGETTFGRETMLTGGKSKSLFDDSRQPDTVDMVVCQEVKEDFSMPSSTVQQMTSGDPISIARKGKTAVAVPRWTSPLALAGNAIPRKSSWRDFSGAIVRRCLLFAYNVTPLMKDSDLPFKIEESTPALLPLFTIVYLQFSIKIGTRSIWTPGVLSDATIRNRDVVASSTQPLRNFILKSGRVKLAGPDADGKPKRNVYMTEESFRTALSEWTRSVGLMSVPYTEENYSSIFEDLFIERGMACLPVDGSVFTGQFLFGIETYNAEADFDGDEMDEDGDDGDGEGEDEPRGSKRGRVDADVDADLGSATRRRFT